MTTLFLNAASHGSFEVILDKKKARKKTSGFFSHYHYFCHLGRETFCTFHKAALKNTVVYPYLISSGRIQIPAGQIGYGNHCGLDIAYKSKSIDRQVPSVRLYNGLTVVLSEEQRPQLCREKSHSQRLCEKKRYGDCNFFYNN